VPRCPLYGRILTNWSDSMAYCLLSHVVHPSGGSLASVCAVIPGIRPENLSVADNSRGSSLFVRVTLSSMA
jgi:hypothetical protein